MISSGDMFRTLSEKEAAERTEEFCGCEGGSGWGPDVDSKIPSKTRKARKVLKEGHTVRWLRQGVRSGPLRVHLA